MSQTGSTGSSFEALLGTDRLDHKNWETALTEGIVLGLRCEECGYETATPKAACPRCGSRETSVIELPTTGRVYSKTTIHVAPDEHGSGYQIALVSLGEAKLLVRIADGERAEIDDEVELMDTYEHAGDIAAVFEPIE